MTRIHFILGGQSSGKTRHALTVAEAAYQRLGQGTTTQKRGGLFYLATATNLDAEMAQKAADHQTERAQRGMGWQTVEEPLAIDKVIAAAAADSVWVIDSLGLWLCNIMMATGDESANNVNEKLLDQPRHEQLSAALVASRAHRIIIVSDEVGLAPVPADAITRQFARRLGLLHQHIARLAQRFDFVVAGIPLAITGEGL
ncbi:MAG: bifunctional adenosylcobinamide kinase/adenosylcobinamide-phosphate guanylyltransferase [Alphaproteobacteria bacterium]|nr:bifunctional adenosylcobinamide kinase/adenosylcobinamide-phosphate guanylyltransferase [Alphaproteobacteria bacterium]